MTIPKKTTERNTRRKEGIYEDGRVGSWMEGRMI